MLLEVIMAKIKLELAKWQSENPSDSGKVIIQVILLSFAQCVKVWNDHNSLPAQYLIDLAQYFFSLAQYGHLETVKLLLDAGADPNIKNRLKI